MAETTQTDGEVVSGKSSKTQRLFYNAAGEETNRVQLDSVAWKLIYVPTGDQWEGKLTDLKDEVRNAAALFGILTNVTNAIGSKSLTDDECIESIEKRLEALSEGRWAMERDSGPRTSDLVAAMRRLAAEQGRDFTDEAAGKLAAILADEKDGPAARKKYMSNDLVKAHYDAIKHERATERLKKSQAAKAAAKPESADDLFNV